MTGHGHSPRLTGRPARALWIALVLNGTFLVAEVAGGLLFGSLALLSDGVHMASDVAGLAIALGAERLARRPPTLSHSFGWRRAEVLGALANAALLLGAVAWIVVEAVGRLADPHPVDGGPVLLIASGGLVVNVASAVLLARAAGQRLNLRGAHLHMVSDAAGSIGVIVAAVFVISTDRTWADPVTSLAIAALVLWSTLRLLRDVTHVLLEATPAGIDPDAVTATLLGADGVTGVHHLHLWSVASDEVALSAHVILRDEPTLHDAQAAGDRLKVLLAERFHVVHATLELECHPCPTPDADCA